MTLDLIGILCSITVLNPSVREGALAFLFARTAKVTSLPKWDARYSSFVFSQAFTSAGHHILYVPLPFVSHSFSSHTKHSRFSHVRLTLPQSCCVSTGKLITWWAVQVPLLREVKVEKAKREIWNLKKKKTQLGREQVSCTHDRGSSPKLWVYLAIEQVVQTYSSQEIMDMAPLSRELSWPFDCTHSLRQLQH